MDPAEDRASEKGICSRCEQVVTPQGNRCPRCGSPMRIHSRRLPILIGLAGVLALLFVVFLMMKVIQNSEAESGPATQSSQR